MKSDREITLTNLPLCQFKTGQRLMVKFGIGNDFYIHCPAEFITLERGRVKVKLLDGWSPTWYDRWKLEAKYPNRVAVLLAKNCYVWGADDRREWPRCHWFIDTKTPAK